MKYVVFEIEDEDTRAVLVATDPRGGEVMYRKLAEGTPLEVIEAIVRAALPADPVFVPASAGVYHPDPPVMGGFLD